jgi:hypothetical protein
MSSNPVLRTPEISRSLIFSATPGKQDFVNLPQKAKRQRKSTPDPTKSMVKRGDVVADLNYIVERYAWFLLELEKQ